MGLIFKAPAVLVYVVAGFWGLGISFGIVQDGLGTIVAIISLVLAPFLLGLAPWYAAIFQADWFPVLLVYGGGIIATILYGIGAAIDRD